MKEFITTTIFTVCVISSMGVANANDRCRGFWNTSYAAKFCSLESSTLEEKYCKVKAKCDAALLSTISFGRLTRWISRAQTLEVNVSELEEGLSDFSYGKGRLVVGRITKSKKGG